MTKAYPKTIEKSKRDQNFCLKIFKKINWANNEGTGDASSGL